MFTITGKISGRSTSITWWEPEARPYAARAIIDGRGLESEDRDLVMVALIEEVRGVVFPVTPTGPFYEADLDRPDAALAQLASYFEPGYKLTGDDVPDLARGSDRAVA